MLHRGLAGSSQSAGLATLVAFLIFNFLVHGFHTGCDAPLAGQPLSGAS